MKSNSKIGLAAFLLGREREDKDRIDDGEEYSLSPLHVFNTKKCLYLARQCIFNNSDFEDEISTFVDETDDITFKILIKIKTKPKSYEAAEADQKRESMH